jgi:hypothetical protein
LVQDSGSGNTTENNFDFIDEIAALSRLAVLKCTVCDSMPCTFINKIKISSKIAAQTPCTFALKIKTILMKLV